jgi:hypothetical protein
MDCECTPGLPLASPGNTQSSSQALEALQKKSPCLLTTTDKGHKVHIPDSVKNAPSERGGIYYWSKRTKTAVVTMQRVISHMGIVWLPSSFAASTRF